MAGFAVVWRSMTSDQPIETQEALQGEVGESQSELLSFVATITSLRCDFLVKMVKKVLEKPPTKPEPEPHQQSNTSLQVCILCILV